MNRGCHRRLAAISSAAVLACVLACAVPARAQPLVERFDPAERGSRFFVADSLEFEGDSRLAAGVVASYGNRLRTFKQPGDSERSTLIEHSLWFHPGASYVMAPGARFALDIPIAAQSGEDAFLDKTFHGAPGSPRFGDLRASFDLRLAGRDRSDVDGAVLAGGVSAYLPTGSASDYASDDFARVMLRVASTLKRGPFLGAVRVGYMYRREEVDSFAGVRPGSEANASLGAGYQRGALVVGPELSGSTTLKTAFERRSTPMEVLLGAHVRFGDLVVGAGVGTLLVSGLGAPKVRGVLSLEWAPAPAAPRDRDHDGVIDDDDMCPDVAGDSSALGARGCPPPPTDRDGDGIIDVDDACPDAPGPASSDPARHGCPLERLPDPDGADNEPR